MEISGCKDITFCQKYIWGAIKCAWVKQIHVIYKYKENLKRKNIERPSWDAKIEILLLPRIATKNKTQVFI